MRILQFWAFLTAAMIPVACSTVQEESPRTINIVNFVREIDPRCGDGIRDELYETVVEQIKILDKFSLKSTFLLQYDALIDPRYQNLMKNVVSPETEIGAWWEITRPHVEALGLE